MYRNQYTFRREKDLDRAARFREEPVGIETQLMKVTAATALASGGPFRFLYTLYFAEIAGSPNYLPQLRANTYPNIGFSVSELSNTGSYYSYGVANGNIPAGFQPRQIPLNSYVLAVPHRAQTGTLYWLIVNTQAIDGTCEAPLVGDTDYGTLLMPTALDDEYGTFEAGEGDTDFGTINLSDFGTFANPANDGDYQTITNPYTNTVDYGAII